MDEEQELLDVAVTADPPIVLSSLVKFYKDLKWPVVKYTLQNKLDQRIHVFTMIKLADLHEELDDFFIEPSEKKEISWYLPRNLDNNKIPNSIIDFQFNITVTIDFKERTRIAATKSCTITFLPRNVIYWAIPHPEKKDEKLSLLNYLAVWVWPVDTLVRRMLNTELRTKHISLQADPKDVVKAIYTMLKNRGLNYHNEPPDADLLKYSGHGVILQTVQLAKETLRNLNSAVNCIDSAVLYASLIEAAGYDAMIVFSIHKMENSSKFDNGHALVGWRKRKGSEEYEFLETTITKSADFWSALDKGNQTYKEYDKKGLFQHTPFGSESFAYKLPIKETYDNIHGISRQVSRPSTSTPPPGGSGEDLPEPEPLYSSTGNHFAVLVGADSYEHGDIYNQKKICPYDAQLLYQQLLKNSFHPSHLHLLANDTLEQPTKGGILSRLEFIAKDRDPGDLLLFYYSGAIKKICEDYYLYTSNRVASQMESTAITLASVRTMLVQAAASAKVIILDVYTTELDPQKQECEQQVEDFMHALLQQLEDLTVLASYKEKDQEYAYSLFTGALAKELQQLPGSGNRLTIQNIYDNLSNNKIILYPLQPHEAKQIIVCRPGRETRSYFLYAYHYLIDIQKTLEKVQEILERKDGVKEYDFPEARRILKLIKLYNDPETQNPYREEYRLNDLLESLYKEVDNFLHIHIEGLSKITPLTVQQEECQQTCKLLRHILQEVIQRADELRPSIVSAETGMSHQQ